jgi:hypothetical protein
MSWNERCAICGKANCTEPHPIEPLPPTRRRFTDSLEQRMMELEAIADGKLAPDFDRPPSPQEHPQMSDCVSDELRDKIADAIASADIGFSMNLIRLVDGVHTYSLKYSDGETLEFCDDETDDFDAQDRLYAHVRARKRQRQADAVLSTLCAQGITKPDDGRVLVKALEWEGHRAVTSIGAWVIEDGINIAAGKFVASYDNECPPNFSVVRNTEQEAKAAAQKDYETRILSALHSPSPRSQGDVE